MTQSDPRRYDFVVFGASSFVGKILCQYLDTRLAASGNSWAIAGRDQSKLDAVKATLDTPVDTIIADAHDRPALDALVSQTTAVISTVGPYALHGSLLVEAAAAASTDYCDITGEPQWMQRMIDSHSEAATSSGARIVHACGFDSIPSDIGVAFIQKMAIERFGKPCSQISMRVKAIKGGISGGTAASMLQLAEEAQNDPQARRILANPYALAPAGMREGIAQPNVLAPRPDDASGGWIAPFVMAAVNTRVVHRSHALRGRPWGDDFLYDEAIMTGRGASGFARATAVASGVGGLTAAAAVAPIRKALGTRVLPKPGEGPSPQAQHNGFFDLRFYGDTPDGDTITTKVTGDRDPGYGSTAKMLGEAAIALSNADPADVPGGFWTASSAFGGAAFVKPLEEHAGLSFSVLS